MLLVLSSVNCRNNDSKAPDIEHSPVAPIQKPATIDTRQADLDLYGDPLPEYAMGRLGSLRMVDRSIREMIFTASGTQAISTHRDGFQLWDLTDASRVSVLAYDAPGDYMDVSPNGKRLATSTDESDKIVFWNLQSGKIDSTLKTQGTLVGLCYLSDSIFLSLPTSSSVSIWDLSAKDGAKRSIPVPWKKATSIACPASGSWVAIGTEEGDAYILNTKSEKHVKLGTAEKAIRATAVTESGSSFAFGSEDEIIYLWNGTTAAEPIQMQAHDRSVMDLAFSPDGKLLISTGGDSQFRSWEVATGDLLEERTGVVGLEAQRMALSPDGNLLLSWSVHSRERGSEAGRWWLWNASSGAALLEPKRHANPITAVAFAPDGKSIATSSEDRQVRVWDAKSTANRKTLTGSKGSINDLQWARDNKAIYTAGVDALVNKWNLDSEAKQVTVDAVGGAVNRFVLTSDGSRIITGDQIGRVWSWDVATGNRIQAYDKQGYSAIYDLAISSDNRWLAIAGSAPIIRIIDLNGGREVAQLNPGKASSNYALQFSPDGKVLTSGGDSHSIQVWNTADWTLQKTLPGHDGTVRCLAFTPDGKTLVSGGNDEMVKVWNLATGEETTSYAGHQGVITDLAISPDGKTIASASRDKTVLLWKIP